MTDYTPHTGFALPAAGKGQYVVASDTAKFHDEEMNKIRSLTIDGNYTLTEIEHTRTGLYRHVTGTVVASYNVDLLAATTNGTDAAHRHQYHRNETAFSATIQVVGGGGTNVTIPDGMTQEIFSDGTDVYAASPPFSNTNTIGTFSIPISFEGKPTVSQLILPMYVPTVAGHFRLKAGLTGSTGYSDVASVLAKSYDIKRNGASVGSADIAAAAKIFTFTFASDRDFVTGAPHDYLQVVAPVTPDATHADFMINLQAELI